VNIKAVLFDLDGTLIDTLEDLTDCMNTVLAEFGFPSITQQQCRPLLGIGLRHLCEQSLPAGKQHFTDNLMERFRAVYADNFLKKSTPYPGIMELTNELVARGIKMAVVTNKNEDISAVMIRKVFGNAKFEIIRGAVNGIGCKPDPAVTLDTAAKLGSPPRQTLFVGDGEADIDVAKNAGIQSVWVSWGFRSLPELGERTPNYIINHPLELIPLLQSAG
jgi:phosphoglycolate phosphatase